MGAIESAYAGVIVAPTSATANVGTESNYALAATYNQLGLSATYTGGVTDFDAFVANATHNNISLHLWSGPYYTPQAEITYDLGGIYDLESFALWNRGFSGQGIKDFELIFSETEDFDVGQTTTISDLTAIANLGMQGATLAEVFALGVIRAGFVKLNILSAHNTAFDIITFGEVAFEGTAVSEVPLPAAVWLFVAGLGGLGFAGRQQPKTGNTA